jgi:hypothetical protein
MPAPTPTVRSLILGTIGGALVATLLALPGSAVASDADRPGTPPPPPYAKQLARTDEGDIGNPGYHYAAAHTQVLASAADGLRATLSVHRPHQVRGRLGQHSLGQIAVGHSLDSSYLEAGWRQYMDGPRLFVYWRPADGSNTCYNFGCGFRPKGPGVRPGELLTPETEITIAFQHIGNRWWLKVDGKRTGYYPDRLWHGRFEGTDFAQLYGEVFTHRRQRICADMGNGKPARNANAAYMRDARWLGGPALKLHKATTVREVHDYGFRQTSDNSFRYGGPGAC